MKYTEILEKAKDLERIVNSYGTEGQLKSALELFGKNKMLLIAGCFIRQIHRETMDDFQGYHGMSIMMDDRNCASFELSKQLMGDAEFARIIEQMTSFFVPLGAEEMRFSYYERIYNRMFIASNSETDTEAAVVALYFTQTHRTLQQNLFRICCHLLKEEYIIDPRMKVYLPYI